MSTLDPNSSPRADGSAGDADYGRIGEGYTSYRQPEPEFEAAIRAALGPAWTILNIGAGAGSYEPRDLDVTAVEPSAKMRAQRPADRVAAIDGTAENLPFADDTFDAAMATFTVHQWSDLGAGLVEVRRVTRGPVVVLTCDPSGCSTPARGRRTRPGASSRPRSTNGSKPRSPTICPAALGTRSTGNSASRNTSAAHWS
ncbi:hypothetical protein JOF29_005231 [Kribbella aluminosa]|uniref:Methyltransferase type 11 domain-containing protein n=1 Tax=Kribbella aluminosa TaxID=416017 RepID=A0ABS4UR54_9ACTN|nr:class I SAM-dependent methyltransferase [Kribbella aluminosa]MBP2354121.1 hypothetical protein [Kribbella aluminosa]